MLNPPQLEAVQTIDGPLLINAGAGSGKTHTVTERVVHMIHDRGIDPRSILCVTFTNKAAKEMRERIAAKLGVETGFNILRNPQIPFVSTFHSMASFFLRMFIDRLGYGTDFVIYDSDDCLRTVKMIMKTLGIDEKENNPRAVHGMISQAKGKGMTPDEFSVTVDSYFGSVVLDVYRAYAGKLKQDNALDFDDLLLYFRKLLDIPEVKEYFHQRFEYIMVDEYQDTNQLQYEMIRILAEKQRNLCVVGDDWQGIYSWRGADIQNIMSFKKDYPEAKIINLEQNYRSTQNIISAANHLIKKNLKQMEKHLFTENEVGSKILLLEGLDEKHEAETIASTIKNGTVLTPLSRGDGDSQGGLFSEEKETHQPHLTAGLHSQKSPPSYSDWAILYRTNGQSRLIEEALIRKNIPYRVYGGMKFYERKEIKDILSYIRLLFNPADTISLKRIINTPGRKIGDKSVEVITTFLSEQSMTVADLISSPLHKIGRNEEGVLSGSSPILGEESRQTPLPPLTGGLPNQKTTHPLDPSILGGEPSQDKLNFNFENPPIPLLTPQATRGLQSFLSLYAGLREEVTTCTIAEIMDHLVKRSRYDEYLSEEYGQEEAEEKMGNVTEFMNMASRYDGLLFPENMANFLEDIALITDQDKENDGSAKEAVSLMTIHLAKGLEFPNVIIAGAEEGVFPHSRTLLDSSALEEERRLMYVAITRAKRMLYISRAHERYNFGNYSANPKSRFVKEIPDEYFEMDLSGREASRLFGGSSLGGSGLGVGGFSHSRSTGSSPGSEVTRDSRGSQFGNPPVKGGLRGVGASGVKNSASSFALGCRVEHAQYGIGTIVSLSGAVGDIAFGGKHGIKKMNIEIAPLKKL